MAMGEAAAPCLMRSVSQPLFASREFKEGDPLRALTTSISFGRFMSEPLDWERWSSFSHNRTREDVQKHSRPGAVAEKKAFFEAYFNRFASKKSAKPPKKENRPPNYSPQTDVSPVTISNKRNNQSPTVADTNENMSNRVAELEITSNQDVSSPSINLVFSEKQNVGDIISNGGPMEHEKTSTGNISSPTVSSSRGVEREIPSNEDACSPSTNNLVFPEIGNVDEKPSTNLVCSQFGNVEEDVSSNKGEIAANKDVISEVGDVDDIIISSDGQMEQETISTENVSSENHCFQVKEQEKISTENVSSENHCFQVKVSNQSSDVDKNKKKQIKDKISGQTKTDISSVKSSSRKAPNPEIQPKNQIFKHNLRESSVNGLKKSTQALPRPENKRSKPLLDRSVANKTVVLKKNTQPLPRSENKRSKPLRDHSVNANETVVLKKNTQPLLPSENKRSKPLRDHSVNANETVVLKKNTQPLLPSENKRSKPLFDHSVNANKTVVLRSHSTNHSEALITSAKKPRSITVPSTFSFKSDERAAKRKQFFQKLEEQPKLKEKARSDDKKLRWSTALEAKRSTSETNGSSIKIQKVEPTQTRPQKLGMKPKNFIEINKKKLSCSIACLPSKRPHDY